MPTHQVVLQTVLPERPLPLAAWFNGFPVYNYAVDEDAKIIDCATGAVQCLLPSTHQVTRVPSRVLNWTKLPDGTPCTQREYSEPIDLPSEADAVAVILPETYDDLHTWNVSCCESERIDLSWMILLGPPSRDLFGPRPGYYDGFQVTAEVLANRRLVTDKLRRKILLRQQAVASLPLV